MSSLSIYNEQDFFWRRFAERADNPYRLSANLDKINCVFIHPTKGNDLSKEDYPIALGYMASLVRMNAGTASICTYDVTQYHKQNFESKNLVCVYPMAACLNETLQLIASIKSDFPQTKIVFFNSEQHQHEMILNSPDAFSFGRQLMLESSHIDFVLIGEAEAAFLALCEKLALENQDYSNVPACLYRKDGSILSSETRIRSVDFTFLPYPARDFLELSRTEGGINLRAPRIQSARGCVAPCLYCIESSSNITRNGRKVPLLRRSIDDFISEIEMLQDRYGVIFFNVIDSSFEDAGKRGIERMQEFCSQIEERKIEASFKIHLRAETVCKLEDSMLSRLKCSGVDIIGIGVESGIERELRSYRKIADVAQSRQAVKRVEEDKRFFCIVGHMMFSPILQLEELEQKLCFLKDIDRAWDYLDMSNNVIIFPGTAYHDEMKKLGLIYDSASFSSSVPYRFVDPRVESVARFMGQLKGFCPHIITLNNEIYDSMNIISRYQNRINQHLHERSDILLEFRNELESIQEGAAAAYSEIFLELLKLAAKDFQHTKAVELNEKIVLQVIPSLAKRCSRNISRLLSSYEDMGLSTTKLTLKTWMSIINTQINTASGKSA